MNLNPLITLSLCLSLIACQETPERNTPSIEMQDSLFKRDAPIILEEIKEMLYQDQAIRRLEEYGTTDTLFVDRLEKSFAAKGVDQGSLYAQNNNLFTTARFKDSIAQLRNLQDERHTKRLVELITKYGYPASDRIDSTLKINPFLLLHHPSFKYKDTLLVLLAKEVKAKRLDTTNFEIIKWDLNGREGLPNIPMDVKRQSDGSTIITFK